MRRVEWANSMRGIAAFTVVIAHLGVLFWVNQTVIASLARQPALWEGDEGAPWFAVALNWLPIEFGALGVALFFLLSGYVIAISTTKYSRRGFVVGRLMRVLPTYAAGFLVTCAVILALGDPFGELSPVNVLAGLVPGLPYLVKVASPADGIVWTLIVELVFYAVVLLFYRSITRRWWALLAVAVGCIVVQLLLPTPIPGTFSGGFITVILIATPFLPIMLIGMVLSSYRRGELRGWIAIAAVPLLSAVYFLLASLSKVAPTGLEYRLTFVGTVAVFVVVFLLGDGWKGNRVLDFFADISYPLYVVHSVLGYATISVLVKAGVWPLLAFLIAAGAAIGVAYLLHLLVESPTHRIGQRWARSLGYRGDPAPQAVQRP